MRVDHVDATGEAAFDHIVEHDPAERALAVGRTVRARLVGLRSAERLRIDIVVPFGGRERLKLHGCRDLASIFVDFRMQRAGFAL